MTTAADVTVRPFEDRDRARLAEVADRAFARTERVSFDPEKGHTLVAEAGGEVIGGAVLRHVDVAGQRVGFTDWIFADPDRAVPGTGSLLRDAALEWFDEAGTDETIARIDAANSASQELHRRGGYQPLPFREQIRRWGRRLPGIYLKGHGIVDTGLRMWVRDAGAPRVPPASRLAATWGVNVLLLAVVSVRAPREITTLAAALVWLPLIALVLLGLRESALRGVARARGLTLAHVPWPGGAVGVGLPVAAIFGGWAPMFGSSVPDEPGWRYERDLHALAIAHVAAGAVVAGVAWLTVLWDPGGGLPWTDIRRAATTFALLDLVPFARVYGNSGRVVHDRSAGWWAALAAAGAGPMVLVIAGWAV